MKLVRLLPVPALFAMAVACGGSDSNGASEDDILPNVETLTGKSVQWVYSGPLPQLESPKVEVSLLAHVALVTGLLPKTFDVAKLPSYVKTATVGGRTQIAVAYPVATAATDEMDPVRKAPYRNWPGDNATIYSIPFTPSNHSSENTDATMWGGFPFIKYAPPGHALHGPIDVAPTAEAGQVWKLKRGPVSHGCNRMNGEHIVELAHLIGTDMASRNYVENTILRGPAKDGVGVPVLVREAQISWNGKYVDSSYPVHKGMEARVTRPAAAESTVFPSWDASAPEFQSFVCPLDKKWLKQKAMTTIPAGYCRARWPNAEWYTDWSKYGFR
ncbi:MAG: L,D-transpeptidase family protein [Polyangiaceae bacterium]|nr:L,D-transpeptidase family protein [Polyangiaceae bacterium]